MVWCQITGGMHYRLGCRKGYGKDYGMCYHWDSGSGACRESSWSGIPPCLLCLLKGSVATLAWNLFAGLSSSSLFAGCHEVVGAAACIALDHTIYWTLGGRDGSNHTCCSRCGVRW